MHAQVPQYIDVEDKIIGPFTLKQFLYLLIGGGIIFLMYSILRFSVFIILAIPIAFFVLLLAFYKIGTQKFSKFIINFLGFVSKPNIYIWKKLPPKKTKEQSTPEITKETKIVKELPKEERLEEAQWKIEL